MRVAIAGGHGKIALHLTRLLSGAGCEVLSLIRDPDHAPDVRAAGGKPVLADLEAIGSEELTEAIRRVDAVVFAAGAGPGSGADRKETVDYGSAVKLMEAGKRLGIAHYVMISAKRADPDHPGDAVFDVYLRAKGRADRDLRAGGLPYTIVAPTSLTNDEPSGTVTLGRTAGGGKISRADVAATIAALIERGPVNETLELSAGSTPIAEAVAGLR